MPAFLAIETSQREGGVAVRVDDGPIHVETVGGADRDHRADVALLPAIDRLFARAEQRPADLRVVAVSIGPGGFTGLRLAVSAAKMLALSCGCDLVAVPSAFVVAESMMRAGAMTASAALVVLAVKGESFWATLLDRSGPEWRSPGGRLADAASVPLAGVGVVIGDEHLPAALRARCDAASIPVLPPRLDPAAALAVGEAWHRAGRRTAPSEMLPLYPRPPEAVTLWRARRDRGPANRTTPDQ